MKFFVIACCFCFLGVVLFLDLWKYFMGRSHPEYWTGLAVVPILMLAKLFLGVYYNLSVWYKLTNQNLVGAWITLGGAAITIVINFLLIPVIGYMACAIATICCYGFLQVRTEILSHSLPMEKTDGLCCDLCIIFRFTQVGNLFYCLHVVQSFIRAGFDSCVWLIYFTDRTKRITETAVCRQIRFSQLKKDYFFFHSQL
jgi:hypothetical protein